MSIPNSRPRAYARQVVLWIVMGGCIVASLRDSPFLAELPFMPAKAGRWLDAHENTRHLWGYVALTLLAGWAFLSGKPPRAWLPLALSIAVLAAVLEAAQTFVPNRHADLWDVAWSWAGVVGASLAGALFARWKTGRRSGA